MTKTTHYALMIFLSLGLAAGSALGAGNGKGKGGGGGDSGGDPSRIGVIGIFLEGVVPHDGYNLHILNDSDGQFDNTNVGGGWVELPGTGNFVLNPESGGQELFLDVTHALDGGPASGDDGYADYQTFVTTYAAVSLNSMSVNRRCYIDDYDEVTGACSDISATDGSLKEMTGNSSDLVMSPSFSNIPIGRKEGSYDFACGPRRSYGYDPAYGDIGTTPMVGRCTQTANPLDPGTACIEWRIAPYIATEDQVDDIADFDDPTELRCALLKEKQSKGTYELTVLGYFDLRFGLTVKLDADRNGIPDVDE